MSAVLLGPIRAVGAHLPGGRRRASAGRTWRAPGAGLQHAQTRRRILRVQLQEGCRGREGLRGGVHRLHPRRDALQLLGYVVQLGVGGVALLLHRGHGCRDLLLHDYGFLLWRQIADTP